MSKPAVVVESVRNVDRTESLNMKHTTLANTEVNSYL